MLRPFDFERKKLVLPKAILLQDGRLYFSPRIVSILLSFQAFEELERLLEKKNVCIAGGDYNCFMHNLKMTYFGFH